MKPFVASDLAPGSRHDADVDVLVIGGGINGCGIARDLAGRGWSVLLVEQDDLASHTSSASTKLIHGGLRYLEYYEFALVRKALQEREVLLRSAPHIMWPLRFVMPHDPASAGRPAWLIRMGLFMYDHLARREVLPGSVGIDLRGHPAGAPLAERYTRGFEYSDGWVDDARLVALNAIDAAARGATIATRTRCSAAVRHEWFWEATLDGPDGRRQLRARALVNAAGPWAEQVLRQVAHGQAGQVLAKRHLRLVKGSHIIVPRRFEHDKAYIFQNPDRRIIFAIPYEEDYTLIGTTDVELPGEDPGAARIDAAEITYLCEQASRYFKRPVLPAEVVSSYSGVRPLIDDESGDPAAVTRDYLLETDRQGAALLTVWGGKITTFRKLAEDAAAEIGRCLGGARASWTREASLPGGDLGAWIGPAQRPDTDFARFVARVGERYPWLPAATRKRLARAYGSRIDRVLGAARQASELGRELLPGFHEAELDYLRREEWVTRPEDVLWRRSKLGLHVDEAARQRFAAEFAAPSSPARPALRVQA